MRLPRPSPVLLVGLGFAAAWAVEVAIRDAGRPAQLTFDLPGVVLLAVLALRRRHPLLTVLVFALGFTASSLLAWATGTPSGDAVVPVLALVLAVYSLGAYGRAAALLPGSLLALLPVISVDLGGNSSNSVATGAAFFAVFVVGLPLLSGRIVRGRSRLVARLREQQRQLAEERAAATSAALAAERLELADRLHDELVTGVQRLVEELTTVHSAGNPAAAVGRVEGTARELLSRTRRVVVTLGSAADLPEPMRLPEPGDAGTPVAADRAAVLPWTAIAAAALCVGMLVELSGSPARAAAPFVVAGCLAVAAPLAVVWAAPLAATVTLWVAAAGFAAVVHPLSGMFAPIGLVFLPAFFVAALTQGWRTGAGLAVCGVGLLGAFGPADFPGGLALMLLAWAAGRVLADRGRLIGELRATTAQLAARRQLALHEAVLAERARVARELHDAVGHRLTVLALQATAARRLWATDRARAEAALETVAEVAEAARAELRQSVVDGDPAGRVPLATVAEVIEGARAAGLAVRFTVDGGVTAVHPAAHRLVQEALTNVFRHAPGADVQVTVRCADDRLEVQVVNSPAAIPSPVAARPDLAGGSGLAGLRRRVEQCDGRLTWGRRPDGGFSVAADFPVQVPA
jgi:signal transduction histidine kinase